MENPQLCILNGWTTLLVISFFNQLEWLAIPGVFAIFIRILNTYYYESLEKSAVSALYSVCMSIWAVMFAIVL